MWADGRAEKIELPGRALLSFIRALRASKSFCQRWITLSIDAIPGGLVQELSSEWVTKGQGWTFAFLVLSGRPSRRSKVWCRADGARIILG